MVSFTAIDNNQEKTIPSVFSLWFFALHFTSVKLPVEVMTTVKIAEQEKRWDKKSISTLVFWDKITRTTSGIISLVLSPASWLQ